MMETVFHRENTVPNGRDMALTFDEKLIPGWAHELRRRYLRGEAAQFIVHGNVNDLVLYQGELLAVTDFLCQVMLAGNKDVIALYNTATGVRFQKRGKKFDGLDDLLLERSREKVFPKLELLLTTQDRVALILEYAETLSPAADISMYSDSDRSTLIALHRWSLLPALDQRDNLILLMTENLTELHPRLVNNPRVVSIRVPIPGDEERAALVRHLAPALDDASVTRLTEITAGLKSVQIRGILAPQDAELDVDARKAFIGELLGAEGTPERVEGLARITKGMDQAEIRKLVAPGKAAPATGNGVSAEIEKVIFAQKRAIIERECAGLLEFIDAKHGFEVVGGMEEVKRELKTVAGHIREGRTSRVPMGFLFVGPMGTGKSFVAEAFAKESGLTTVKFGSFRSKWVGATESNLERILDVLSAMGQVIVVIDEVDRALGGGGEGDGGTESRVIARLKEFMAEPSNRGRLLFLLMSNRPDLLDTDIKRAGRIDRKIPFFYPQTPEEVLPVLEALIRRHALALDFDLKAQSAVYGHLSGYSNADIEGALLLAASRGDSDQRSGRINLDDFTKAVADYLPSRDMAMIGYMELLAVFEASNRSMLPAKYASLSADELSAQLQAARLKVGVRR